MIRNFGEVKSADAGAKARSKDHLLRMSTDYRCIVLWKSNKKAAGDVKKGSGPRSAHPDHRTDRSFGRAQNLPLHKVK
jgi:hypothetical protein